MRLFINAPYLPILSKANFLYTSHRSLYNPDKPGIEQGKVKHRECYMYECLSCKTIPFVINFTAIIKIKSLNPSFKVYNSHQRLRCGLTCFLWTCLFPGFRLMTVIQLAIAIQAIQAIQALRFPGILILAQSITTPPSFDDAVVGCSECCFLGGHISKKTDVLGASCDHLEHR